MRLKLCAFGRNTASPQFKSHARAFILTRLQRIRRLQAYAQLRILAHYALIDDRAMLLLFEISDLMTISSSGFIAHF